MRVKRKDLEMFLQQIEVFTQPKIEYEQYPTPSRVAANLLWYAGIENEDIFQKRIIDLGCGSGILSLGAAFLGANSVYGIDIDFDALMIAKRNSYAYDFMKICSWLLGDARIFSLKDIDTTIMNPPFGMRKESISRDRDFLLSALSFSKVVYLLTHHLEKTRLFFNDFCERNEAKITAITKMDFDMGHHYRFHTKSKHIFQVDLYRIINLQSGLQEQ